jgi:hypothetical protein
MKNKIINHILNRFPNTFDLQQTYRSHPNYSKLEINNFLPVDVVQAMAAELEAIPLEHCKKFTRKDSCMYEYNDLDKTPIQDSVIHALHSSTFLKWLQEVTDTVDLIPDPHLVGAGYAKAYTGDSLKVHTDFNWNDQLRLHRRLSVVIYLNEDWHESWGGNLDFYDTGRENILSRVIPSAGNMVVWSYNNLAYHGYPEPMTNPEGTCRKSLRLFYYVSNAQHDDKFPPHRSLYWFDEKEKAPYDKTWIK